MNLSQRTVILLVSILFILVVGISGVSFYMAGHNSAVVTQLRSDIQHLQDNKESIIEQPGGRDVYRLPFNVTKAGSQTRLSIEVPEGQSACIWIETSQDYATGANIFTTESIGPGGNSQAYDAEFHGKISATCRDKYEGKYEVVSIDL